MLNLLFAWIYWPLRVWYSDTALPHATMKICKRHGMANVFGNIYKPVPSRLRELERRRVGVAVALCTNHHPRVETASTNQSKQHDFTHENYTIVLIVFAGMRVNSKLAWKVSSYIGSTTLPNHIT